MGADRLAIIGAILVPINSTMIAVALSSISRLFNRDGSHTADCRKAR